MNQAGFLGWLARTPVILSFLAATFVIGGGFYFVMQAIDGELLDMISDGEHAITRLSQMTADQQRIHFRATVGLDTLCPVAYGGFFCGLLARFSGRWRWFAILPPVLTMLADYGENTVQAIALGGGQAEILLAKDILTPVKTAALSVSVVLCVLLGLAALVRQLTSKQKG